MVNSDLTYLATTHEHRDDISTNRLNINDMSDDKIPAVILDVSTKAAAINDISASTMTYLKIQLIS
jgi:hypothetical protein